MPESIADLVLNQLAAVLREAIEGSPERWSYFTDSGQKGGFIGTLTPLTAEDASLAVGGTSIAAHVHHVAWGMDATAAWIRGDREGRDWKESWKIMTGDREAWTHLVGELRGQYDQLRQTIHSHALDGDESFGGAVAAIAHLAYHLGAVRQKIALLHQR
ncbi:MAG TPA: hypothetical protein VGA58_09985 [bacterium]